MGEEIACVSCYRGPWESPTGLHSSIRTCNRFPLLTLQHISPPSREELNLFLQSFSAQLLGFINHFFYITPSKENSQLALILFLEQSAFWHFFCTNLNYHTIQFILQNQPWHPSCCCKDSFQGPPGSTELRTDSQRTWPQPPPYKCLALNHSTHGLV